MSSFNKLFEIRKLEQFLFEGPETAENNFEIDDNFHSQPFRNSNLSRVAQTKNDINNLEVKYKVVFDKKSKKVQYLMNDE